MSSHVVRPRLAPAPARCRHPWPVLVAAPTTAAAPVLGGRADYRLAPVRSTTPTNPASLKVAQSLGLTQSTRQTYLAPQ